MSKEETPLTAEQRLALLYNSMQDANPEARLFIEQEIDELEESLPPTPSTKPSSGEWYPPRFTQGEAIALVKAVGWRTDVNATNLVAEVGKALHSDIFMTHSMVYRTLPDGIARMTGSTEEIVYPPELAYALEVQGGEAVIRGWHIERLLRHLESLSEDERTLLCRSLRQANMQQTDGMSLKDAVNSCHLVEWGLPWGAPGLTPPWRPKWWRKLIRKLELFAHWWGTLK